VHSFQVSEGKVLERFKAKTSRSGKMFAEAEGVSPGGVMAGIKFFEPYPIFMEKAAGSHVWDVDGNEYVDYLMSYGALILGHGHPRVRQAIASAIEGTGTTVTGTPTRVEAEYGRMLRELYHMDGLIRFTNSGLESTLLAVRLARGHTRKRMIGKFEGHYHGAVDHLLVSYRPQVSKAGDKRAPAPVADSLEASGETMDSLIMPFNNWEATHDLIMENSKKLACVILEPFEEGVIAGEREFMTNLRGLTKDLRIPLIFDEVKTGFRVRIGGAGEYYSIEPDLTCLGKIIGGGLPVGAVVGDSEILSLLDPRRGAGKGVFHSGTFNGNPLTLAAGKATVETIVENGNFERVCRVTSELKRAFAEATREQQMPSAVIGEGGMFNMYFTGGEVKSYRDAQSSDLRLRNLLDLLMLVKGAYLKPVNRYCLSTAHSDEDVRTTKEVLVGALAELASAMQN
jgi:glutamate-1-semialdehyde 2,1-aminomutase